MNRKGRKSFREIFKFNMKYIVIPISFHHCKLSQSLIILINSALKT